MHLVPSYKLTPSLSLSSAAAVEQTHQYLFATVQNTAQHTAAQPITMALTLSTHNLITKVNSKREEPGKGIGQ